MPTDDATLQAAMQPLPMRSVQRRPVEHILLANKDVPFVARILDPNAPKRRNTDGSVSSHLMADATVDGRYIAYPTLRRVGDQWVDDKSPFTALDSGNFIEFPSPEEASEFALGSWKNARGFRPANSRRE